MKNRGAISNDGILRTFDLAVSDHTADLWNRPRSEPSPDA